MITGFNTDVKHRDAVFHVQTEDKGKDAASIESLVYVGGRVLARRRVTYHDLLEQEDGRDAIASLVERQHRLMIAHIRKGRFDVDAFGDEAPAAPAAPAAPPPPPPPTGADGDRAEVRLSVGGEAPAPPEPPAAPAPPPPPPSEAVEQRVQAEASAIGLEPPPPIDESLSLDQVIFDYLASMAAEEHLVLIMDERPELASGGTSELEFRTHASRSGQPVPGARISVRMISTTLPPSKIAEGVTDDQGELEMTLEVPEVAKDSAALIITASSDLGDAEIKYLL